MLFDGRIYGHSLSQVFIHVNTYLVNMKTGSVWNLKLLDKRETLTVKLIT